MALTPFNVEQFGGLQLAADPEEVGLGQAVDLLNVDFDYPGRVRSRDGYDNFTTVAGAGLYSSMASHSTTHLLVETRVASNQQVAAINSSGVVVANSTAAIGSGFTFASVGTTSATYTYGMARDGSAIRRWDGSAWSNPAGMPTDGGYLVTQPGDNRLVHAGRTTSKVSFSDAGLPETFGANNYVYLTPGDGEDIAGAVAWNGMVFIFKRTKFFVFYGNSTDSTGNPIFNYRTVEGIGSGGVNPKSAVAGPNGVYFVAQDGIYVTTGGPPAKISTAIDPLFGVGSLTAAWQGGAALNFYANTIMMVWHAGRLYCAFSLVGGGTGNTRMLVWDQATGNWTFWDVAAAGLVSSVIGSVAPRLFLSYVSSANTVAVFGSAYTTDDGTAITSRFRSGLSDLGGPGTEKTIRQTELVGQGVVSLGWSRDFGAITSTSTANVTMGTAPATARALHRLSQNGELLGYQISSVSGGAWQVNRVTPMVRPFRQPGDKSTT